MISEMRPVILPIEQNEPLEDRSEIEHEKQQRRIGEQRPHGGHVSAQSEPCVEIDIRIARMFKKEIDQRADDSHGQEASIDDFRVISFVAMRRRREKIERENVGTGERQADGHARVEGEIIKGIGLVHGDESI